MIRDDQQLSVVQRQLITAEEALDSLRRGVRSQNREMYQVMAEPYIDMIHSLRAEIDSYLGIESIPESADIIISLKGSGIGLGQTSAGLITRFIDTFRRGLQSAVEIQETVHRADTSRRRERWIEKLCDLPLVGVTSGSVRILLSEPESKGLFTEEERRSLTNALDFIFTGLKWADTRGEVSSPKRFSELSEESRQSLLAIVTRLLPPRSGQIESVYFERRIPDARGDEFASAALTRESRDRIRREIVRLASDTKFAELEGVIRSVDLDAQTFVLRERADDQPDLLCEYGADLEDAVKEYLDSRVIVTGSLETSRKTQKSKLSADNIELRGLEDAEADSS